MDLQYEFDNGGRVVARLSGDNPATELGRSDLVPPAPATTNADRTVSRRHVSLRLLGGCESTVAFEVVGRNPVVVRSAGRRGRDRVCRRGETGALRAGDGLSLSLKAPSFWSVRKSGGGGGGDDGEKAEAEAEVDPAVLDAVARRERRTRERKEREVEMRAAEEAPTATTSGELDAQEEDSKIDLASIDPVRELGFLSIGHEFDSYPRGRIRPPKDWNWFLEEIDRTSDDEDEVSNEGGKSKGSRAASKKKDKGEGEDEDWTGDSEDEKDSLSRGSGVKRQKYVTRSKDPKRSRKEISESKRGNKSDKEEDEEEDEEDETLGGFIVNEEDEPMEVPSDEEEEEFDDEEDDD